MVIIITGATHSGKTNLAQQLLENYHYPYVSQDHIKMGLIRAHYTELTPMDSDEKITDYLWPVTREMIKTAIENKQNLIIEGCYIPFDWKKDFEEEYLREIRYICLCLSQQYIDKNFSEIVKNASCIEKRIDDSDCTIDMIKKENERFIKGCEKYGLDYALIKDNYKKEIFELVVNSLL